MFDVNVVVDTDVVSTIRMDQVVDFVLTVAVEVYINVGVIADREAC